MKDLISESVIALSVKYLIHLNIQERQHKYKHVHNKKHILNFLTIPLNQLLYSD